MNRRRIMTRAIPLLLSVGLVLSACTTAPDYGATADPYTYTGYYNGYEGYPYEPINGALGFNFGGFDHFHHDRDFGHGHYARDFAQHVGYGFARARQHGFAENVGHGFAGHGGFGGHRG